MTSKAIVAELLEDDFDAHVKAHERVQHWHGAHSTFGDLYALKQKSLGLMKEMGRAIAYERELARNGIKKDDVENYIYGSQIGSTHNFKLSRPVRRCKNVYCKDRGPKPEDQAECLTCGDPLKTEQVPYSPSDLYSKFAKHIMGVETKDGRCVWFDEPVPPQPVIPEDERPVKNPVDAK